MKKLFTILISLLYISTSTGASIHMHYCMGKIAGWGLIQNSSNTCGKCGMEKTDNNNDGCCKDEVRFIKNVTDQKTAATEIQFLASIAVALPSSFDDFLSVDLSSKAAENLDCHDPPRNSQKAVYLLNRCFRI